MTHSQARIKPPVECGSWGRVTEKSLLRNARAWPETARRARTLQRSCAACCTPWHILPKVHESLNLLNFSRRADANRHLCCFSPTTHKCSLLQVDTQLQSVRRETGRGQGCGAQVALVAVSMRHFFIADDDKPISATGHTSSFFMPGGNQLLEPSVHERSSRARRPYST